MAWLDYLDDMGYRELYLGSAPVAGVTAPAAVPGRDGRRPGSPEPSIPGGPAQAHPARPPGIPPGQRPAEPRGAGRKPAARDTALRETAVRETGRAADGADPPEILTGEVPENRTGRARLLVELGRYTATCRKCRLAEGRKSVVFGSGNPHADLMFVGEAPGAEEDRRGLPFVGPAGQLLTKIIQAIERTREEVYIANIVKCRPPENRDPRPDEVTACRPYLERQIQLIRPKVIVALGRVAAQTLLGVNRSLGDLRGEWWMVEGVETRVTYHPAALLRSTRYKRPTWEDMQVVRDRLRELAAEEGS